jgi:Tol biopolymer transport system component
LTNSSFSETSPVVTPDGTKILFLSDESEKGKYNLYATGIDGGSRTQLTTGLNILKDSISVSPDSSMVAFITLGSNGSTAVHVIDMHKSQVMVVNGGYMATWSGDGKKLYYASSDEKSRKIVEYSIGDDTMKDVLSIEYKPGEESAGIKFLHFTDKLKE